MIAKLYRGDSTKITNFDLDKCYKTALFGRAIYLTDNLSLAKTYTSKDRVSVDQKYIPLMTTVKTRDINKLIDLTLQELKDNSGYTKKYINRLKAIGITSGPRSRDRMLFLYENGQIFIQQNKKAIRLSDGTFDFPAKLIYHPRGREGFLEENCGYISVFETTNTEISTCFLSVDSNMDTEILRLLNEYIDFGFLPELFDNFEDKLFTESQLTIPTRCFAHFSGVVRVEAYLRTNSRELLTTGRNICFYKNYLHYRAASNKLLSKYGKIYNIPRQEEIPFILPSRIEKIRDFIIKQLSDYGYKGIEYKGGILTGSAHKHRAFACYDDDWVNERFTKREKTV